MKAYKLEILVVDFDELEREGIREAIANARFPNDCLSLEVKSIVEKDIGEWCDEHPLNSYDTADQYYKALFSDAITTKVTR